MSEQECQALPQVGKRQSWAVAAWTGLVLILFFRPVSVLVRFAAHSDLYSYTLLIPLVSGYLVWCRRGRLTPDPRPARWLALAPALAAVAALGVYAWARRQGWKPTTEDYLALMMLGFLGTLFTGVFLVVGRQTLRQLMFPASLLVFVMPFPTGLQDWIEAGLQHGSAIAAGLFFRLGGMPFLRDGTLFQLPDFAIQVAPECSGIHSTVVLFITSLLAGYLFLRTGWGRALLTLAVIPLALLRNGLRIFVIGELCVNVSHDMINSYIHRRGGPIFFVLSLVPFFGLLLLIRRIEQKRPRAQSVEPELATASPERQQG